MSLFTNRRAFLALALAALAGALIVLAKCRRPGLDPSAASLAPSGTPAAPAAETFVVFSDTQQMPGIDWVTKGGTKERRQLRDRIFARRPDYVIHAGDVVGVGSVKAYWNYFRREFAGMRIWPVIGNHDLHGPDRPGLKNYFDAFPHLAGRRWYELKVGAVLFLMLDSNKKNMSGEEWQRQGRWLKEQLDRAAGDPAVRAVALVLHYPPLSLQKFAEGDAVKKDLYDLAAKYPKFRLCFSGHHHAYQHIEDGERHVFVAGGGGAPLHLQDDGALPEYARLARKKAVHHLIFGRVEPDHVALEVQELENGSWTSAEMIRVPFPPAPPRA